MTRALLESRAAFEDTIRGFFLERGVLEVRTPLLARHSVSDPHIESLSVPLNLQGTTTPFYLQTSPEFAMKRLLASGSGDIFQLTPAFRGGESGERHNPEFTMLEWYRVAMTLDALMLEAADLVSALCERFEQEQPERHLVTYAGLFQNFLSINPHRADTSELLALVEKDHPELSHVNQTSSRGDICDALFSTAIEPRLSGLWIVTGFPASQAALAKVGVLDGDEVALRSEIYWDGLELANGYDELRDAAELEARHERDNEQRRSQGLPEMVLDQRLLAAMNEMPACSGIALGIDRLLMKLMNKTSITEVLVFPITSA